ncbi:MAG: OmpH family outer membrane protein, partial [Pseudomonadota bacterium]
MLACLATILAGCVAPPPTVGVVDVPAVARALGRDDLISARVTEVNNSLRTQLVDLSQKMQAELQIQRDALGESASEEALGDFEQTLSRANDEFEKVQRAALVRSRQARDALVSTFRREVVQVAQEVAAARGVSAILTVDASLLWFEPTLDMTDEVIASMRS